MKSSGTAEVCRPASAQFLPIGSPQGLCARALPQSPRQGYREPRLSSYREGKPDRPSRKLQACYQFMAKGPGLFRGQRSRGLRISSRMRWVRHFGNWRKSRTDWKTAIERLRHAKMPSASTASGSPGRVRESPDQPRKCVSDTGTIHKPDR